MPPQSTVNSEVAVQLAVLQLKYELLEEKYEAMNDEIKKMTDMASRWKGGGAVIIALGSVVGFLFTYWDKIKKFLF